jgi:hypothetical protein
MKGNAISEGTIQYKVTYPYLDSNNVLQRFLPAAMTMHFKNDKIHAEFLAGFGLFKTGFISDSKTMKMSYLLKLINVKYTSHYNQESAKILYSDFPKYKIVLTEETKVIAGYQCKKVIVDFIDEDVPDFSAYYTYDIKIKKPNWSSPLSEIDGVLLEYELEKYNLRMHLTADKIIGGEIADELLSIPKDYEEIPNTKMNNKIRETFQNFQY